MDNLTHSLAGALLGQMGLKKKTGLAMPTLIIAANLPDIDAVAVLLGGHTHLAIRRGMTHGPIALVILPFILWGIMLWFDRWQGRRGKRPENRLPVHKGWLLALAYIGTISHPALDWLNTYGIRFLEPFTDKWFYGDTLFIIDIWVWAALVSGVWISIRRERRGAVNWQRPAWVGFAGICTYIFMNGAITGHAEGLVHEKLEQAEAIAQEDSAPPSRLVVAQPVPVQFWKREMLWRNGPVYGTGWYSAINGVESLGEAKRHGATPAELKRLSELDDEARAFLFWSRMPIITREENAIVVKDQRFLDERAGDRFTVRIDAAPNDVQRDGLEPVAR